MADTPTDVLVGAYPDIDAATSDFDALAALVEDKQITMEAAILITHAADGSVTVAQTADHRGRKGVEWGGAVGVLVGLAAPPLLAATAVGAVAGGLIGKFVDKRLETEMHDKIGENLPAGYGRDHRGVRRLAAARGRAGDAGSAREVARPDGQERPEGAQGRSRGGNGQVRPRPHGAPDPGPHVRRHDRPDDRPRRSPTGRSSPGPKAPEGAPNVLLILIDDAGFGQPDTFGGGIRTPNMTRVQKEGLTYNRFHVVALCSPTRAAMLTGRNQHRVGMGSVAEFPGPFPGYTGARPKSCTALPRILTRERVRHRRLRQVAHDAGPRAGSRRPLRPLADSLGLRPLLGLPERGCGPVRSARSARQHEHRRARGQGKRTTSRTTSPTSRSSGCTRCGRRTPEKPWFLYYSTGCAHAPHHVAKEWADKYKGVFDDGWDAYRERTFARQKELGVIPQDAELTERPDLFAGVGLARRRLEEALRPPDGGLRGLPGQRRLERRPPARRRRGDGRPRRHARRLHLGRQRRQHGGDDDRARSTR